MGSRMRSKGNADASPRELYLDLLVKILTNTIYGDPSIDPDNPDCIARDRPEPGRLPHVWPWKK